MNYFELFGLPVSFNLELAALSNTYRELQKQFHPDKFANASERDRLLALQKASEINDAFQTLKFTIPRAEYMLSLAGVDIRAEQKTLRDPIFLMQQMEWRERVEEIGENADPETEIVGFEAEIKREYQALESQMVRALESQAFEDAADLVRKLKFMAKLQDELECLEESLLE